MTFSNKLAVVFGGAVLFGVLLLAGQGASQMNAESKRCTELGGRYTRDGICVSKDALIKLGNDV